MKNIAFLILVFAVFISAIEVVMAQHQARKLFVEIQSEENSRNKLNEDWGKLQLEQSTWATDLRIETIARNEMEMKPPEFKNIKLLAK